MASWSHRSRLAGVALVVALGALGVPGAGEPDPAPRPETRKVFVTDRRCQAKAKPVEDHRTCVRESAAKGEPLFLRDPARDALYEITYSSEERRSQVQNEFAGLEVYVRGLWDDREKRVTLLDVFPIQVVIESPGLQGRVP